MKALFFQNALSIYLKDQNAVQLKWGLGILSFLFFLSPLSSFADQPRLVLRAKDEVAKLPLRAQVKLVDFNFEGARFSMTPSFRVAPNRDLVSYSRYESLGLEIALTDGGRTTEWIDVDELGLSARFSKKFQVEFIRQFNQSENPFSNQLAAINLLSTPPYFFKVPFQGQEFNWGDSLPVTLEKIPVTAEGAKSLSTTDYFRYKIEAAFSLSTRYLTKISDAVGIQFSPNLSYVAYGDFQVEVYRLEEQRVLVRASSLRSESQSIGAGVSTSLDLPFEIGVRMIDRQIGRAINRQLINLNLLERATGNLFAFEFEFDLTDPLAAEAYDRLMNPQNWRLQSAVKIINPNPLIKIEEVRDLLLISLEEVEALSDQMAQLERNQQSVRRAAVSGTSFKRRGQSISLNTRLIRGRIGHQFDDEHIAIKIGPEPQEQFSRYRLNSLYQNSNRGGWLFWNRSQRVSSRIEALFATNESRQIEGLEQIVLSHFRQDKQISDKDRKRLIGKINLLIPEVMIDQDPELQQIINHLQRNQRAQIDFEIESFISQDGYVSIAQLGVNQINQIVREYYEEVLLDQVLGMRKYGDLELIQEVETNNQNHRNYQCSGQEYRCALRYFDYQIRHLSSQDGEKGQIARIFDQASNESVNDRWKLLTALRSVTLFRETGAGLLIRLVERSAALHNRPIDKLLSYRVQLRSRRNNEVQEWLTESDVGVRSTVYQEILRLRARSFNRGFDLELMKNLLN